MLALLFTAFLAAGGSMPNAQLLNQERMEDLFIGQIEVIERQPGYIAGTYEGVKVFIISDVKHDRMRIIAAITNYSELTPKQKDLVLEANFHQALDARYAVSKGVLYSAFIHPMSSLSKKQLLDALDQVTKLARSFGSSYSSGGLIFRGN